MPLVAIRPCRWVLLKYIHTHSHQRYIIVLVHEVRAESLVWSLEACICPCIKTNLLSVISSCSRRQPVVYTRNFLFSYSPKEKYAFSFSRGRLSTQLWVTAEAGFWLPLYRRDTIVRLSSHMHWAHAGWPACVPIAVLSTHTVNRILWPQWGRALATPQSSEPTQRCMQKTNSTSCFLTSTTASWYMCMHIQTHTQYHTHKQNQ